MSDLENDAQVALLDKTYETTVDPLAYDEFMEAWDAFLAPHSANKHQLDLSRIESGPIHIHFNRAVEILERMAAKQRSTQTADAIVRNHDGIGIVVNRAGRITAVNAEGADKLDCETGHALERSSLREGTVNQIFDWIASGETYLVLNGYLNKDSAPLRLLAVSIDTAATRDEAEYFISSIDLRLTKEVKEKLKIAFSLSAAEIAVAERLLKGESPKEIADARSASINTIRSQIKNVLQKMDTRGIADLVRVLCSFIANSSKELAAGRRASGISNLSRRYVMEKPGGREIEVTEHGARDGTPVLMFHAMLWGVSLPRTFIDACAQKNLRILAPTRAGYGGSAFIQSANNSEYIDTAVEDARFVLDQLNIDHVLTLGHIVGSIYAQRFAARYPQRCKGVLYISHAPYWRDDFLARFPKRQRLVARTAKLAPAALGFVTRAGASLIESGGHDRFLLALHGDIPADAKALRRPDIHAVLCDGIEFTTRFDTSGFCQDSQIGMIDWSGEATRVEAPIRILYGAQDNVISKGYIEGYLETASNTEVTEIENAGMHLLYSHWPQVIRELQQFL